MTGIKRTYFIGDQWLYYKLYSGPRTIESILLNELYPLTKRLKKNGLIDKFFFIRYTDPEYHLRVRFHLTDIERIGTVILEINNALKHSVENRIINKVSVDTYTRELERYGKITMEDVETFFDFDSHLILDHLAKKDNDDQRWIFGVSCVDQLFNALRFSSVQKENFCRKYSNIFLTEFGNVKGLRIQLDDKYRKQKKVIESLLAPKDENSTNLKNFYTEIEYIVARFNSLSKEELLEVSLDDLVSSLIHMHFNRLFRTKQRMQEFVLYYFMEKFYMSVNARLKYSNLPNTD